MEHLPLNHVITKQYFSVTVDNEGKVRNLNVHNRPFRARGKVPAKLSSRPLDTDKLKIIQNRRGYYASVLCRMPATVALPGDQSPDGPAIVA